MAQTIPGGYYLGANGQPHDANGKPLPLMKAEEPVSTETVQPAAKPESTISDVPAPEEIAPAKPKRTPKAK